jgi:3-deoxy-D-arabino-heptulosonate 7-phosphate (DAHP) synthase class II
MGSRLGGVHFELTGENVTECTGGPQKLLESDLPHVSWFDAEGQSTLSR